MAFTLHPVKLSDAGEMYFLRRRFYFAQEQSLVHAASERLEWSLGLGMEDVAGGLTVLPATVIDSVNYFFCLSRLPM